MEKGKDLIDGGAVINGSGAALIGLADVADSLSAIERVVFEEKAATFETLLDALKRDFEGYGPLLKRLRNPDRTPKYGNEDPAADGNVRWVPRGDGPPLRGKNELPGGDGIASAAGP